MIDCFKRIELRQLLHAFHSGLIIVLYMNNEELLIQCSGCRISLYTCKGESCKAKCPPHIRKCSKCAGHNYSARHRINRKYYASQKSRSNSNSENSISFESLINQSSDSVVDKDLPEIWNNAWLEQLP
ncbi:9399_t:CDS:2 [Dentiscutata erythropus]|uniref:9399_t:CDS:1 n=1 Tax=Dentiscutata erythropus TaxID=1348616 RepID=A0A9N9G4D4_9GLOM|nr:9399_t:CDS:2 [Dentiscutata erythropus]